MEPKIKVFRDEANKVIVYSSMRPDGTECAIEVAIDAPDAAHLNARNQVIAECTPKDDPPIIIGADGMPLDLRDPRVRSAVEQVQREQTRRVRDDQLRMMASVIAGGMTARDNVSCGSYGYQEEMARDSIAIALQLQTKIAELPDPSGVPSMMVTPGVLDGLKVMFDLFDNHRDDFEIEPSQEVSILLAMRWIAERSK